MLVHELSCEAKERVRASRLSKREIIRLLQTSAPQFHRLLDRTSTRKSIDRLLKLFRVLGYDVDIRVRAPGEKKAVPRQGCPRGSLKRRVQADIRRTRRAGRRGDA